MNENPDEANEEEQIEKMKTTLVYGLIIVVTIAALFAFMLYGKISNG